MLTSGNIFVEIQDQLDTVTDGTTIALDLGPQVPGVNFYYQGGLQPVTDAGPPFTGNWIVRARLQVPVTITSIAPDAGPANADASVTVTGTGFDASCTLALSSSGNATPLPGVSLVSSTELHATVPAGLAPGPYDVVVTCTAGNATLSHGYTVQAASGSSSSSASSGTSSSSSAASTSSSTSASSSSSGGTTASSSAGASSHTASRAGATSTGGTGGSGTAGSSGASGSGTAATSSSSSSSSTSSSGAASTSSSSGGTLALTGIAPASGPTNQSTAVTIEGANFVLGVQVLVGSTLLTDLSAHSASVLSATVPSGIAVGTYDVVAVNPDGARATLHPGFTVTAASSQGAPTKGCGCGQGVDLDGALLAAVVLLGGAAGGRRRRSL